MKRGFFQRHSCRRAFSAILPILFFLGLTPAAPAGTKTPTKPVNDDFENRIKLGSSAKFDNTLATFQDGEPSDNVYIGYSTIGHSLWWTWTAPRDGQVVISVDSQFTCFLGAYSGDTLSNLTAIQQRFGQPLTINVAAKTALQVSLDGYNGYGSGKVIVKFLPTPANDNFAKSQVVSGSQAILKGNNTAATQEPGEMNSPDNTLNHTVWFKWAAPATGYAVLVPASGLSYLVAGVYTGNTVSNLTTVATSNPGAALGFNTVVGKTYYIAIDGAIGWQGPFSLELSLSTIHLTSPKDGALFYEGDPIPIAAAVSTLDGNGQKIEYYAGGQLLGSGARSARTGFVWKNAPLGDYSLRAIITDSHNVPRISGPVNIRVRPPNDDFTNAFALEGLNVTTNGINAGAGKETGEPTGGDPNADGSVWYTWTAPASGEVWVSVGENYFSGHPLGVYTGDSVSNLVALSESIYNFYPCHFVAHTGDKVHIEVSGFSQKIPDGFGPFTLSVEQRVAPTNDDFANRIVLSGTSAQGSGTLTNATAEPGEPNSGPSVWWSWTAPETGTLFLNATSDTLGANFNFYTGDSLTNLQSVGGIGPTWYDATGASGQIQVVQGVTYQIMLTGSYVHGNGSVSFDMELAQAVPNDNFANAYPLTGVVAVGYSSNTIATAEAGEPASDGHTVWWSWTAPVSGPVSLGSAGSDFGEAAPLPALAVYTGTNISDLVLVTNGEEHLHFMAVAGVEYHISADSVNGYSGQIQLTLVAGYPANDNFNNRLALSGTNVTVTGSTEGATSEASEPNHGGYPATNSIWYTWMPPAAGTVIITITGDDFLPTWTVYNGSTLGSLSVVADSYTLMPWHATSTATFLVQAGVPLQIAVDGSVNAGPLTAGIINLNIAYTGLPPNDNFANRIVLSGTSLHATGDTSGATVEPGEQLDGQSIGYSIWWSWTAPATGHARLDAAGSVVRTVVGVSTGNTVSNLTPIATGLPWNSPMTFECTAGTTYQIDFDSATYSWYRTYGPVNFNLTFVPDASNNLSAKAINGTAPQPPAVSHATRSGSEFTFELTGKRGTTYTVLTSTNLFAPISEWQPILTTNLWEDSATIQDATASGAQRYYRIQVGP